MFRADIDALEMDEENFDLPYRSTIKCAHMCGHDGHTVCLLGFCALLMENI
jgi:metal-dependent amidase/aminoacylase/carboxypeptidase family protein